MNLFVCDSVFVYLCIVLYNLKSNYEEALSRNDVKAIVITGIYGDHSFPR